jgi:hypothetical protein
VTNSINNTGNVCIPSSPLPQTQNSISALHTQMFEKFSLSDIDSSGGGGEYVVQAGFGWTNGVVLWVASTYGHVLVAPQCPSVLADFASAEGSAGAGSGTASGSAASGTSTSGAGRNLGEPGDGYGLGVSALVVVLSAVGMLF